MRVNLLPVLAVLVLLAPSIGFSQALPLEVRKRIFESVVSLVVLGSADSENDYVATGSGTIVGPNGHILTNNHVIELPSGEPSDLILVLFTNPDAPDALPEFRYLAMVVDVDPNYDLALLQIIGDPQGNLVRYPLNLAYSMVGDSNALLPGDSITVVGYPGISGQTITFTSGLMSGFLANDLSSGGREWIKTDAKLAPGNSGGAAFNTAGELVGIPTARIVMDENSQEYIRPVHLALPLLERHIAGFPEALRPEEPERVEAPPVEEPEQEAKPPVIAAAPETTPEPTPEPTPAPPETRAPTEAEPEPSTSEPSEKETGFEEFVQVGVLTESSNRDASGRREDPYDINVEEGTALQIDARSSDFDIAVRLYDPTGQLVLNVDDTPGQGRNVAESLTAQRSGLYRLVVTSAYPKEIGQYQVEVRGGISSQQDERVASPPSGDDAEPPEPFNGIATFPGRLDATDEQLEGYYYDTVRVYLKENALVTVGVDSAAFIPMIAFVGSDGYVQSGFDNTTYEGVNSASTFVPTMAGEYDVLITSAQPDSFGDYEVRMTGVEWVQLPTGNEFGEAPSRGVAAASDGTNSENYSGAWIGCVNDSIGGAGELAVTISQVGSSVTGTWRAEFATQITGGIVWGEMRGGELLLEMIPSRNDACPYNAVVTREQQIMVGTYAAYNCTIHISGELRLLKQ